MINKNNLFRVDYLLLGAVVLLVIIGILTVYSAGFDPIEKINSGQYRKQLVFFIIGLIFMIGVAFI
ncbi:MAG TPA: cell division protein FtsW, partial [Spirochaetota bacterium]